jgi:predicted MFS family arabinose efflux permease
MRDLPRRTVAGLFTLCAAAFIAVTTETMPTGLLPQIGRGLHVSTARAGLLIAVYALVVALSSVPLAVITNRLPRKKLILASLAGYALSSVLVVSTSSFALALGARVVGGLAHAIFFTVASAYVIRLVPHHLVGRSTSLMQAGGSLALVAGVPLGTALGLATGWRSAFLALAAAGLILMVLAARLLPPVPSAQAVSWGVSLRGLRAPGVGLMAVLSIVGFAGHYSAFTYISPLLRRGGIGQEHLSAVLLGFGIGGLVGVLVSGTNADRRPRTALITSFAVLPLTMLVLQVSVGFPFGAITASVIWAMAFVATPTLIMTTALRAGREHPDMAAALINASSNVGIALGAAAGGLTLSAAGLSAVPLVAAVFLLGALAIAWRGARIVTVTPRTPVPQEHQPVTVR